MSIKTWFLSLFQDTSKVPGIFEFTDEFCRLTNETYIKHLAIETAINLISNTLALAEFKTFDNGKEIRKSNYYLLNIEPNPNQNASRFWRKIIYNLVYENHALALMQDERLYVADEFERKEFAFKDNYYESVEIDNYRLKDRFYERQVFYFALHSKRMKDIIDSLYSDYGKLLEYSKTNYKRSNARRGVLEIPANYPQTTDAQASLQKLLNEHFKAFYTAENGSVLPLTGGLKYTDLTNQTYKNGSDSRDIRSLVEDVFDYVAIAFQIPPNMLKGSNADSDKSWDAYMTQCIKPLAELLEKEINRKMYGKDGFLEKSYLKIDTTLIKTVGIKDLANAVEILTRTGVNTLDDNLRMLGREEIGGDLGQTRFATLNLTTMEKAIRGGEDNRKEED